MQAMVSLCNKKGKIIKNKPTPFIEPDYYDAVEIDDSAAEGVSVRLYLTLRLNTNIKEITNKIFERIENSFKVFDLGTPKKITIMYKGIIAEHSSNKKIEVKREYNC